MASFHSEVIRKIGGRAYVADALGLPYETVKSWGKRGIPARYWHRVVELAQDPDLTIADLERTKSPGNEGSAVFAGLAAEAA